MRAINLSAEESEELGEESADLAQCSKGFVRNGMTFDIPG